MATTLTQNIAVQAPSARTRFARVRIVVAALLCTTLFVVAAPAGAEAAVKYRIYTQTCDVWLAGTDANVWIRLDGTSGNSGWLYLNKGGHDDFRRDAMDGFSFMLKDLGSLKSVVIKRDNAGSGPGWCLDTVYVAWTIGSTLNSHLFGWYNWIPNGGKGTRLNVIW